MKHYLIILFLFHICIATCQETFEIIENLGIEKEEGISEICIIDTFTRVLVYNEPNIEIHDYDAKNGVKLRSIVLQNFKVISNRADLMINDEEGNTYVVGTILETPTVFKLDVKLKIIDTFYFEIISDFIPYPNSMIKIGNQIVIAGSVYMGYKYDHQYWIPYIIWFDELSGSSKIDFINDEDNFGHINNISLTKDNDNNIIAMYSRQYHNPDFSVWADGKKGFIKYNAGQKKELWRWEDSDIVNIRITPHCVLDSNNLIYFHKLRDPIEYIYPNDYYDIVTVDSTGLLDRKITIQIPIEISSFNGDRGPGLIIHNNELLVAGSIYSVRDSSASPANYGYICKYSLNGEKLWSRAYRHYMGNGLKYSDGTNQCYFTIGQGLELTKNGIIFAGRLSQARYEPYDHYSWLTKVDSIGCYNDNFCNDIVTNKPISDVPIYDQPNMTHKEFYYHNVEANGHSGHELMSFGTDTVLFIIDKGNFSFRYVNYQATDGTIEKDKRAVRWIEKGRIYCAQIDSITPIVNWRYDEPLYDFTLKVGEIFTLPEGLGSATVINVDSTLFLNGYTRKRLILRFDDPELHAKFGEMTWVEGIGALDFGFFYQDDLKGKNRRTLTCYYDRSTLKYKHALSNQCLLSGISETSTGSQINLYPNPTSTSLTIQFSKDVDLPESYAVSNSQGQILRNANINSNHLLLINVEELNVGFYFIHFIYKSGYRITKKWIRL